MQRLGLLIAVLAACAGLSPAARSACGFFVPTGKNVSQPSQQAFITWDAATKTESFTVQPVFEGDAADFGMVIPTPSRPKLSAMPRDFFSALDAFTTLAPTPAGKFKVSAPAGAGGFGGGGFGGQGGGGVDPGVRAVRVLEAGMVGTLDYKIVVAERGEELFDWLKENGFAYAGDEKVLESYIRQGWGFTVMRIDPSQMRKAANGRLSGDVTPTRFTFQTAQPVYPLHITRVSAPKGTDAILYLHSRVKLDLAASSSYQFAWAKKLKTALDLAYPQKLSPNERAWMELADRAQPQLDRTALTYQTQLGGWRKAQLEYAKQLTREEATDPRPARTDGLARDAKTMTRLRGHLRPQWLIRVRKQFCPGEMAQDLHFQPARLLDQPDISNHTYVLPNAPF